MNNKVIISALFAFILSFSSFGQTLNNIEIWPKNPSVTDTLLLIYDFSYNGTGWPLIEYDYEFKNNTHFIRPTYCGFRGTQAMRTDLVDGQLASRVA